MQWMIWAPRLMTAALAIGAASATAGCMTTAPVVAGPSELRETVRRVVGTDLIGARGATGRDQGRIDATVAGLCAAEVWTRTECRKHAAAKEGGRP